MPLVVNEEAAEALVSSNSGSFSTDAEFRGLSGGGLLSFRLDLGLQPHLRSEPNDFKMFVCFPVWSAIHLFVFTFPVRSALSSTDETGSVTKEAISVHS